MRRSTIHCHTTYSDGEDSLESMVDAAIRKGFVSLGFSEHAWNTYDLDCRIALDDIPAYLAETARLKEKYRDRIELYAGLEVDCYEPNPKTGLDFTIGSVHFLYSDQEDKYYTIDYLHETFRQARDRIAGGEIRAMVELYYDTVVEFAASYRPDVIGHLDLIAKLNGDDSRYFDENSTWYRNLTGEVAERIAGTGCIVEVNTGGMYRGYRSQPYPAMELLSRLREQGVPVMVNSDAHEAEALDFWFDEAEALLRQVGYRSTKELRGGRFVDVAL